MGDVDQETIRRVLGGDRDAYGVLMKHHFAMVFRVTFRITGNHHDAEEATQEAFLRAYEKLPEFRNASGFGTWVYRIAMNCAFDLVRRRCREASWNAAPLFTEQGAERFAASYQLGAEEELLNSDAVRLRHKAMELLTPMERTAFVLKHLEEKSVSEIAVALGVTTNSVKQAIFRAVGKLRRVLRENPGPAEAHVKEVQ